MCLLCWVVGKQSLQAFWSPASLYVVFLGLSVCPHPGPGPWDPPVGCLGLGRPLLAFSPTLPGVLISHPSVQSILFLLLHPQPSCLHSSLCPSGLSKTSDQAYIEFESIEAIVKTASRTKFFIEFYSTCLEGQRQRPGLGVGQGGWEAKGAQSSQLPA